MPSIREMLLSNDPSLEHALKQETKHSLDCAELIQLSNFRKKAFLRNSALKKPSQTLRVALIGGATLYPLQELVEHLFWLSDVQAEFFQGKFDNYHFEIMEDGSDLYAFRPEVIFVVPNASRVSYTGKLTDKPEVIREAATQIVEELISLATQAHQKTNAQVILANFIPSCGFDLGQMRLKSLASDWAFKRLVNQELGLKAPAFLHVCDFDLLSSRRGILNSQDLRAWYESKQPGSPDFLVDIAKEIVHTALSLNRPSKKVLVLDADNTLWGGIIGEDGMDGIALGDTTAKGQAFKFFQNYILSLKKRGILLALCSKNEESVAREVFQKHPEMLLKESDFVSFKANWKPKPENIREIAAELNLGLESFVFVDDSPGEIEIVNQWTPEVSTLLLSDDPASYVQELQDTRFFETRSLTEEDEKRTDQYQGMRKSRDGSHGSLEEYLESLEMGAEISAFTQENIPRIAQLINKSNQFNLTTQRMTESDVAKLVQNPDYFTWTVRLKDRFVDHGLISIVIGKKESQSVIIETWLMSCRVLQRQVEFSLLNEIVESTLAKGFETIQGKYIPSPKNGIVAQHYDKLGFKFRSENNGTKNYILELNHYEPCKTKIEITYK